MMNKKNANVKIQIQEPGGSKSVTFSPVEERHSFPIDVNESSKINQNLEKELKLWNETFIELTKILTKATPYPSIFIQSEEDKRNVLKQLCESVTNKAIDPTNSKQYKQLEVNLKNCQAKVEELNQRCQSITEQLSAIPQKEIVEKEKEVLDQKISNLEEILKRQIKERKNALLQEKNKVHRRKARDFSLDGLQSTSRRSSMKSNSNTDLKNITQLSSNSSFAFDQTPINKPPASADPRMLKSPKLLPLIEDENSIANDTFA
ncbi:hypothetical protein TRFO_12781 [Tritrichomonas foetus]|uniref:Uncharacterized protein n=1 Tax=Tritrichomonas foetus TaxID=1144522 RepID=A0A1J4L1G7_9EUKA|nr:hypothetical protein TRFO_12781 [Tritrichomonas foetus]|eukprot:OHT16912.1 hypothetical protein TRFO_12781 [Tritrichomonas foetus]